MVNVRHNVNEENLQVWLQNNFSVCPSLQTQSLTAAEVKSVFK